MNSGVKQRLLGAIVLLCIGAILWPVIFSEGSIPVVDKRSQIPPVPAFDKYSVPIPTPPETSQPVPPTPEPEPVPESALRQPEQPVELDQRGLPQAWALQVASFSDDDNAKKLVEALRDKGYKAFVFTVTAKGKSSTRVMIGPKMNQQSLLAIKPEVDREFKVDALLVRYVP